MESPVVHYKAILVYDGTNFAGFQKQAKSRTVQGEVETALKKFGWAQTSIWAAGRTDTGVHASGQVIAFALAWKHSSDKLLKALNACLPEDIAVQHLEVAPSSFRPRQDARSRLYRYTLYASPIRNSLLDRYAWRVWPDLNFALLEQAANDFLGTHDFRAFGTPPRPGGSTIRRVLTSNWTQERSKYPQAIKYIYEIEANAFLFHMVRRIVQLQVTIAQQRLPVESVLQYLTNQNSGPIMGLAPPHGLSLCAVRYADPEL